uniref:Ubiquitin associated protein 2b n=1 Tax=Poecilia latipinna TaxID=48699 RepID=A0A3B3VVA7_9TELE
MMTSVVSNPARGTRDKTLPTTTQTTQPQKQIQATAEQMRLAQVIYDNNDTDFEDKVKQLIEVTGKTQDECVVALHDCNEDANRAINFLLESPSDTNSWETVGKKRSIGKEGGTSDLKESREKKGEREASRGRGASNRRGRGISRGREGRSEENGFEVTPGERGSDRGRRGRGRVFTASSAPANHITPGHNVDLASILPKTGVTVGGSVDSDLGAIVDGPSAEDLGQSLVFTNSHHNGRTATHSYAHSSVIGSGFGSLNAPKQAPGPDICMSEPLNGPRLPQRTSQMLATSGGVSKDPGQPPMQSPAPAASPTPDMEMKHQPEPSAVLSQLAQRQQQSSILPTTEPLGLSQPHAPQAPTPPVLVCFLFLQHAFLLSQIPSSAVEMPGSADISGLNVQFGALDFSSEAGSTTMPAPAAVPTQQAQNSMFPKSGPVRDHMGTLPPAVSDASFPSPSLGLPGATPSPSLGLPSAAAPPSSSVPTPTSRVDNSSSRTLPPHLGFSQSKDVPSGVAAPLTVSTNNLESSSSNLHAFSSSSSQAVPPAASTIVSTSSSNGLHQSAGPGLSQNGTNTTISAAGSRTAPQLTTTSSKAPPNLAQGVPPLLANQYIMGPGGLLPAYPQIYGYEDLQMLQSRLPLDYYGVTFPGATAPIPGRESLANNPYSGEATKFGRNDSSSPAPPTSLATAGVQSQTQQTQQAGTQAQGQNQGQQTQNQAFLNPPLPPGYGYTGLPYYAGMPGVPSAFQYGPTVFVPPASAKQPAMGLANPSSQYHQQHQPTFDDLSQAHGGDYNKTGYGGSAQSQAKSAGSGPGKGTHNTSTAGGVPDMGGSIYSKTQSFDKQGFHTGTPPPFSLPSALGGASPMNPGGAPGYAPGPFLHILPPHQQPHSQLMHHHLTQDGQGGPGQRNQSSSMQQKTQGSKSSYGSSPYWAN